MGVETNTNLDLGEGLRATCPFRSSIELILELNEYSTQLSAAWLVWNWQGTV